MQDSQALEVVVGADPLEPQPHACRGPMVLVSLRKRAPFDY
jgi:hypothetical protein